MLGKLLKYEIKSTYKIFLLLYGTIILFAGINRLFYQTGLFDNQKLNVIPIVSSTLYVILIFATLVITFIIIIQRYYKNLFSYEGYLSLTLPVKASSHILAKGIIGFMWNILVTIVTICSLLILFASPQLGDFISQGFDYLFHLNEYIGPQSGLLIFEIVLLLIIAPIYQIFMIYASISLGQLFSKNRVGFSFIAYFVLYIVVQIIKTICLLICGFGAFVNQSTPGIDMFVYSLLPLSIFIYIVISIIYFLVSKFIVQKKLNLE